MILVYGGFDSLRVKNIKLPAAAEINMIIGCEFGKNLAFMENDSVFL
jgi:hypothetical protein